MLAVGDFNLDQILPEHVAKVDPTFNLSQCLQYSTWIWYFGTGLGTLDLVFDASNSNTVFSLLSPCSDHFVLFFFLNLMHYIYENLSCKQLLRN